MAGFDTIIHQPARLQIMSSLATLDGDAHVEFTYLRDLLSLTDGNLGAHLARLESAGYIRIDKRFVDRKPRTFIAATGKGRDAFEEHIATLKKIVEGAGRATDARA